MFYDFEHKITPDWLDMAENLFQIFGYEPSFAIGNFNKKHSDGSYKRIRKRLLSFLTEAEEGDSMDMRLDSIHDVPEEGFFPCQMHIVWVNHLGGIRDGEVSLRMSAKDDLYKFIDIVAPVIFKKVGKAYGSAFIFPAIYGPDAYHATMSSIPKGGGPNDNPEYSARLMNWCYNNLIKNKRPSQGFFREIYPINFVLQAHLDRDFQGRPLEHYMKKVGTLERCDFNPDIFRWDVSEDVIDSVREALEPSGLVLSAPKIYTS